MPVFLDSILEGNETFALNLRVTVPRVSVSSSRGTANGTIIDSTGKQFICLCIYIITKNSVLVSVRFEQATYSVNENSVSPLQPVLLLSQPFPTAVNVMVIAENVTATGWLYINLLAGYCLYSYT